MQAKVLMKMNYVVSMVYYVTAITTKHCDHLYDLNVERDLVILHAFSHLSLGWTK